MDGYNNKVFSLICHKLNCSKKLNDHNKSEKLESAFTIKLQQCSTIQKNRSV